ncbi:hypothetical protein [Stenotrophomonas sp.]|uniref:hypothetical protein n=1 Tax=Stenotrophomonas sp. TaxID=69392 RepID=UPI0028A6E359|nr:hypothetical protein [Stenotrophomonas sp.]
MTGVVLMLALMPVRVEACTPSFTEDAQRSAQELRAAPINSAATLATYIDALPYDSPLLALSEPSRKRFIESMTFNASGLTGFSYADIEGELSVSQAHALLEVIGSQRVLVHLHQLATRTDLDRSIRTAIAKRCAGEAAGTSL